MGLREKLANGLLIGKTCVIKLKKKSDTLVAEFDLFIGIDWSGAKGQFISGIQLAIARPGTTVPETVLPPKNDHWSRQDVMTFLIDQAAQVPAGKPLLVGIDFAFAHPA